MHIFELEVIGSTIAFQSKLSNQYSHLSLLAMRANAYLSVLKAVPSTTQLKFMFLLSCSVTIQIPT